MSNYELNRTERLNKANSNYYRKTLNLDYNKHHDDYIRDRNIINKVVNKNLNLEILFIVMKYKKHNLFLDALSKVLTDDDYEAIKMIKELNEKQENLKLIVKS